MRSARVVPEKEGDKVVGIRLFGIRQDSLLGTLGLENGDRLSSINGFEMSDPRLRGVTIAEVRVTPDGRHYAYTFQVASTDAYVVSGLK